MEGRVFDRMTLAPARGVRLLFLPPDSIPYSTLTDTAGAFRLRSLPPDSYRVFAFDDRNRNRRLDAEFEPHDSAVVVLPDTSSIGRATFWLVEPDTTPPTLVEASVVDSLRIRLQFDEAIEPDVFPGEARVIITDTLGGQERAVEAMHVGTPPERAPPTDLEAPEAAPDSAQIVPDSVAVPLDSAAIAVDSAGIETDSAAIAVDSAAVRSEDDRGLPSTAVIVDLEQPLEAGMIRITASGFANLRRLIGGGEVDIEYVPPEPEPEPAVDEGDADEGDGEAEADEEEPDEEEPDEGEPDDPGAVP